MYRVLLFLLLILAQGQSESTHSEREYHLIQELRNWTVARDYCQSHYFDLVSILSPEEAAVIANLSAQGARAWIGLYNDDRSSNGWKWTTGETFNYTNWTPSYPREFNTTSPACVYTSKDQWLDTQCGILLPFVCYTVIFQTWPEVGPSEREYLLIQEMRNWTEARDYCQSQHTNLVSILSPEKAAVIANLSAQGARAWIGLYNDDRSSNGWKWTTGETFNYTNWTPSYPREFNTTSPACVYTSKDQWLDTQCGILLPFVCYTDKQLFTDAVRVETNMPAQQASKQLDASLLDTISRRNLKPSRRSSRKYHKVILEKTWLDARDYCQVHHTDLLSIRTKQENSQTSKLFDQIKLGWCGLYNDQQSSTGWKWVNGDRVGYTNWKSGNPYRYKMMTPVCVYIQNGKWSDAPCRFLFPFVCYTDLLGNPKKPIPKLEYEVLPAIDFAVKPHQLAEKSLLSDELIQTISNREYLLIKKEETWSDAQDQCRAQYTDLLTVQSKEENNMASKLLKLDEPAWIGLFNEHQADYSWMWTTGEAASFFNWDTYYPMDFAAMPVCVIMVNGRWKDVPCDFKFSFVCYTELLKLKKSNPDMFVDFALPTIDAEEQSQQSTEESSLSDGARSSKPSSREYFLITEEETWSGAQDQCRTQHTDLITVQNKGENNMASNLLKLDEPAWIGLFNKHQSEYSWVWTTGEPASFFNWATYYPMDFATMSVCVIMVNGRWKDVPCDFKFSFICYAETLPKSTPDKLVDSALSATGDVEQIQERSENSSLSDGTQSSKRSSRKYFLITKEETWSGAQGQCRTQNTDLLTVQSNEENIMASKLLKLDEPAWIGLFNEHQSEYTWMWTNGEALSFFNWATYYPMDFATMSVCVIIVNGRWKDVPCDFKFSFICYTE
ncbi:macrophage mannose receptor 1-like isoform X6 [Scyliorhinus torazame]|uniref:macrophage mannose receptor 1-like isoform X6 n=1 Tax=Scyliorhinus torazame TaxID=75743 RepID=UPI003B591DA6